VRLAPEIDRERVIARLADRGVATSRYLPSIHLQAYMRERFDYHEGMFPVSEEASRRLLSLPFFTEITPAQQERVATELAAALR
jgi:perosamine synthetase